MCIIIHRPAGAATRLSRETLHRCATLNPHGFGLMWADHGKVITARYLPGERKDFIKRALALQALDLPLCLHFRWATHGAVTKENTHPFLIRKGHSALMHNGILSIPCVKGWSDTRTFAYTVVRGLVDGWEKDPTMYWMIHQATLGSKVAIMYGDGSVTILHKSSGISEGGIWYSNDGFRPGLEGKEWIKTTVAWVGKKQAKQDAKRDLPAGVLPFGRKTGLGSGSLPIQSSALYRFEGITICGWCLARESNADDAVLVEDPPAGDQCELCYHSPLVPGSRSERRTLEQSEEMHPDCADEGGRVCTGA